MKNYILILLIASMTISAQAQLKTPALSPSASLKQTIGLTEIEINYSRPSAKGRAIFGENTLLPYGGNWRVGANEATKLTFSEDVQIAGTELKRGSYTVIAIPQVSSWELRWFEHDNEDWTTYVEKEPLATTQVASSSSSYVETFEMSFTNITMDTATLRFAWERTALNIPITVQTKAQTLKSIESTIAGPSLDDYFQAAVFLHETNTDLPKALTYIQKVTASDLALFFVVTREAQILRDLQMSQKALIAAKKALELSVTAENNDFIKINQDIIAQLE